MSFPGVPDVTVTEVPDGAVLLDVREDDEWAAGHAPGAVHIPMTSLAGRLDEVPEADELYVVCRSGGRSARVSAFLAQNGWDVVNVAGGMSDWSARGLPLVSESGADPEII